MGSKIAKAVLKAKEYNKVKKLNQVIEELQDLKMYGVIDDNLFISIAPKLIKRSFELEYNK